MPRAQPLPPETAALRGVSHTRRWGPAPLRLARAPRLRVDGANAGRGNSRRFRGVGRSGSRWDRRGHRCAPAGRSGAWAGSGLYRAHQRLLQQHVELQDHLKIQNWPDCKGSRRLQRLLQRLLLTSVWVRWVAAGGHERRPMAARTGTHVSPCPRGCGRGQVRPSFGVP